LIRFINKTPSEKMGGVLFCLFIRSRSLCLRDHNYHEYHGEDTYRFDDTHGDDQKGETFAFAFAHGADAGGADKALHPGGKHFAHAGGG